MEDTNIAKQFLRGYKNAKIKIELTINQAEQLRELIDIKGVSYDGVKVQTSKEKGSGIEQRIVTVADLDQQVKDVIVIAQDMLHTVQSVIEEVPNDDCKVLLSKRYIKGDDWKVIAIDMGKSVRQIHRIHGQALKEVGNILKVMSYSVTQ